MTELELQLSKENEDLKTRLAVAEKEAPFRIIIEQMEEGAITLSATGSILYCNARFCSMVGLQAPDIEGTQFASYFDQREKERIDTLRNSGREGRSTGEFRLLASSDSFEFGLLTVNPLPSGTAGELCVIISNITKLKRYEQHLSWLVKERTRELENTNKLLEEDIDARKRTEEALNHSQVILEEAQQISNLGSWELDIPTKTMTWSSNTYRIFHVDPETFDPNFENLFNLMHPDDRERMKRTISDGIQTGGSFVTDYRIILKDGEIRYIQPRVKFSLDYEGHSVKMIGTSQDITERKRMEISLEKNSKEMEIILDSSPSMIFYKNKENFFLRVNKAFEAAMGLPKEKLVGKFLFDIYPKEQAEKFWQDDLEVIKTGKPKLNMIESMETPQGTRIVRTDKVPYFDEQGNVIGIIGFALDITEQERMLVQVIESEERFAKAFQSNPAALSISRLSDGLFVDVNGSFVRMFGYDRKELIGIKSTEIKMYTDPEDRKEIVRLLKVNGKIKNLEITVKNKRGETLVALISAEKISIKGEEHILYSTLDITLRKGYEENLRISREQLAAVFNGVSETIMLLDVEGTILAANKIADERLMKDNKGLIGKNIFETIPVQYHEKRKEQISELIQTKKPLFFEDNLGDTALEISFYPVFDPDGNVKQFISSALDITERKKAHEKLIESEHKLKTIYTSMTEGLALHDIIFDKKGKAVDYIITDVNPAFERIIGIQRDQIIGKKATKAYSTKDAPYLDIYTDVALTGKHFSFETFFPPLNKHFNISVFSPVRGKFATVFQDISQRKLAEEALRESEERFHEMFKRHHVVELIIQPETGVILDANDAALRFYGYSHAEMCRMRIQDINQQPPENVTDNLNMVAFESRNQSEFPHRLANGEIHCVEVYSTPVETNGKKVLYSIIHDITKRKQAEEKVQTTLQRFYLILSNMQNGILLVTADDHIEFANKTFCDIFRLEDSPEDLINLTANEIMQKIRNSYPEPDAAVNRIREIVRQGKLVRSEEVSMHGDRTFLRDFIPIQLGGKLYGRLWNHVEISASKKYEKTLHQLIRTLRAMQDSSLMMVQSTNEEEFLQDVCDIIINDCGHQMVWIGYKEKNKEKRVKPVAYSGFEENYLQTLNITWDDTERGRGPTGTAIRTGKPSLCRNMQTDPCFKPWRDEAVKRGYSSSISLPLFMDEEVFGAMMIYSVEPDPFSEEEVQLLTKLSHDLSYGIKAIRLKIAVQNAKDDLEIKVEQRTALLKKTLDDLDVEKKRFQDLLNRIPAYVALITLDQEITFTNKNFTDYFGEVNNQKCYQVFFGRDTICDNCKATKVMKKGEAMHWEAVCKNNRNYEISDFMYTDNDGTSLILEIGVDITDKRNMEKLVMSKILETEERDRRRFASDLHDDLGPTLSAIKLQLGLLGKVKSETDRIELLTTCDQLLLEGIDKMRTVANNLMPNLIESYGIETAVESFIRKMENAAKIEFNFKSNLKGYRLHMDSELHLYRIVTELVNNTIKHSGASGVSLELKLTEQDLMIIYSDNGKGYIVEKDGLMGNGIGIQNMRNRINLLHGTIEFKKIGKRTVVFVIKPLTKRVSLKQLGER